MDHVYSVSEDVGYWSVGASYILHETQQEPSD